MKKILVCLITLILLCGCSFKESSKKYNVNEIYYIDICDDEHNEVLRNKYEIKDGVVVKISDGISIKLKLSFDELTEEVLNDEEKLFDDFFGADMVCDSKC